MSKKNKNKILVTGSSGIIGTAFCKQLINSEYEFVGVDKNKNKWSQEISKSTIHLDLRDRDALDKLPKDIDTVVHLAANARVFDLIQDPSLAKDNFTMLFNVLEFCRENDVSKFVYASSREVYGNSEGEACSEEEVDLSKCKNSYTATKISGESLVRSYRVCHDIDSIILRFSNVYGKYDENDRVVPIFIKLARQDKDLTVYGENKVLDFIFVDDAVSGLINVINKFDDIKNDVFNIGSGTGTPILKLAEIIKEEIGSNNDIMIEKNRTGETESYIADISKSKEKLDFIPEVSIEEGLKKAVEWYTKNEINL